MNTVAELEAMHAITQTKYDQQQQQFQKLVSEENRLRAELAHLDATARKAQITQEDDTEMRAIGADIIWQGWVARTKTQLNLKLAQVLARKLHHLAQVKNAYGKVLVVQELLSEADGHARRKKASINLVQAIEHALLK